MAHISKLLRLAGLLAAVLALAGRLVSGVAVPDSDAVRNATALLDTTLLCLSDAPPVTGQDPGTPRQHDPGHGACALQASLGLPSPTLTPPAMVPVARRLVSVQLIQAPSARAPPAVPPGAALPRGPPSLT